MKKITKYIRNTLVGVTALYATHIGLATADISLSQSQLEKTQKKIELVREQINYYENMPTWIKYDFNGGSMITQGPWILKQRQLQEERDELLIKAIDLENRIENTKKIRFRVL